MPTSAKAWLPAGVLGKLEFPQPMRKDYGPVVNVWGGVFSSPRA